MKEHVSIVPEVAGYSFVGWDTGLNAHYLEPVIAWAVKLREYHTVNHKKGPLSRAKVPTRESGQEIGDW